MITPSTLRERRLAAKRAGDAHLAETEHLKARLARARDKRVPFALTRDEFLGICRLRLRDAYGRSAEALESNSEKRVRRVTEMAFSVKDGDAVFALTARLAILQLMPGVGIGLATAILALCQPRRYAPLEPRVCTAFFDEKRGTFEVADYRRYLARLDELCDEVRALDAKGHWCLQLVAYHASAEQEAAPAPA